MHNFRRSKFAPSAANFTRKNRVHLEHSKLLKFIHTFICHKLRFIKTLMNLDRE